MLFQRADTKESLKMVLGSYTPFDLQNCVGAGWPAWKRCIIRGKNLGDHVTDEQWKAIGDGTFKDMFLGDFWKIGNVTWRIVDFDYWYWIGNSARKHHVVIVPQNSMYQSYYNATNTTAGGYMQSYMRKTALAQAINTINSAFGESHIYDHVTLVSNNVDNAGNVSGIQWVSDKVVLMSSIQYNGRKAYTTKGEIITTGDLRQFLFFASGAHHNLSRDDFWMRDIVDGTMFLTMIGDGSFMAHNATSRYGVKPCFGICESNN